MLLAIPEERRNVLLDLPESGMGYQQVVIASNEYFLIWNAELAIRTNSEGVPIEDEVQELLNYFALLENENVRPFTPPDLEDLVHAAHEYGHVLEVEPHLIRSIAEHDSYNAVSNPGEIFVRYSAFHNDRRVLHDGTILAGTYVTTQNDSQFVTSGLSAVGRYALPNLVPALHKFVFQPAQLPIKCGTCMSKFGLSGGGVEVQFLAQTKPNSVNYQTVIADR